MYKYTVEIYENNAWTLLKSVVLPITDGDVLDETLAEGKIDVKNTLRSKSIKPFTRLRIKCYDGETLKHTIQRVVGTCRKTRKRLSGTPTYDFEIQTLELSKLLERTLIGSMTSTKYLTKQYDSTYQATDIETVEYVDRWDNVPYETTVTGIPSDWADISIGTAPIYKLYYATGSQISADASYITKRYSGGGGTTYDWLVEPHTQVRNNQNNQLVADNTITNPGSYTIEANAKLQSTFYNPAEEHDITEITIKWQISAYSNKMATPKTITSIVERLLSAGKTRRKGLDAQQITFNATQATKYAQAPFDNPPEFGFTNSTLWDALMQIGGAIHAIPRLQVQAGSVNDLDYEIVFDELGGNEDITDKMPPFVYEDKNYEINDFSGTLDSPAQNLVNSQDANKGALSEFGEQYITLRTETTQVEISADTVALTTNMRMNQVVQMYMKTESHQAVNISAYVYEMDEYKTLSQLETSKYPYSTGWALCYAKGSNTITGFNSKLTTSTILSAFSLNYAIQNIWKAVTGESLAINDIVKCSFKIVYVPIVEARILQKKPNANEDDDITLVYNQGANLVETNAYGQKMRGAAARLGQEITRRTYDFYSFDDLPKVGQLIDGAYIAQCNYAFYQNKIRVTVTLTPNFNLLSQYVGLNTNYRLSDISTEQITDRFITYGNRLVFGDAETAGTPIIPNTVAKLAVSKMLSNSSAITIPRINTALIIGYDENELQITDSQILLPVMSFPFGTSWAFVCSCLDNYGAGYQAGDLSSYVEDGQTKYKRIQRLVPYSDVVGEIETLGVWWNGTSKWADDATAVANGGQANLYPYANNTVKLAYQNGWSVAISGSPLTGTTMTTGAYPFVLQKDSKERIGIVYQMHLQANRDSIVIGTLLADNCPLCTNYQTNTVKAYVLLNTINTFGSVDFTGAQETTFSLTNNEISVDYIAGGKSWVIVDDATKQIYIGENTSKNDSGHFPIIYMTTK